MAINFSDFKLAYPEFAAAPNEQIESKLIAAQTFCDARVWGNRYEVAVFLKAAHLLAMSPGGEKMRLAKGSSDSVYSVQFDDMIMALPARTLAT